MFAIVINTYIASSKFFSAIALFPAAFSSSAIAVSVAVDFRIELNECMNEKSFERCVYGNRQIVDRQ